jgi:hypothetical protein
MIFNKLLNWYCVECGEEFKQKEQLEEHREKCTGSINKASLEVDNG